MTQKIALITGANKGIGFETARQLSKAGLLVIVAGRDLAKVDTAVAALRAEGATVESLQLDVTDSSSIVAAVKQVEARHGHLDILINNAGVMLDAPDKLPSQQPLDIWRKTFETNVFGMVEVSTAFLPLLKKAKAARIVNLSSVLGSNTLHQLPGSGIYDVKVPAYNVSKSAVNAWTVQLAHELRNTSIKVNAAHPGYVKTDMGGPSAPMEIADGAKTSVQLALLPEDGPTGAFLHLGERLPW